MAAQGDDYISRGDFMRRIRKLEREVETMKAARRLPSASIDGGNLRVKGGAIVILDADGNETARFATDGLTLEGLLQVIGNVQVAGKDGKLEILDGDGNVKMTLGTETLSVSGLLQVLAAGEFQFQDANGDTRLRFRGDIEGDAEANITYLSGPDAQEAGEVVIGAIFDVATATVRGHGIFVQTTDGKDLFEISSLPDGTATMTILRPGPPHDVLLRVTEADGLRIAVDTDADGIQSGQLTAGPADSAGVGFRTVRLPN